MAPVPGIFLVQHCLLIQNAWYTGTVPGLYQAAQSSLDSSYCLKFNTFVIVTLRMRRVQPMAALPRRGKRGLPYTLLLYALSTVILARLSSLKLGDLAVPLATGKSCLSEVDVTVVSILNDTSGVFGLVGCPSIVATGDQIFLVAFEVVYREQSDQDHGTHVYFSRDNGFSWSKTYSLPQLASPQLFKTSSGVYLMGTEKHFSFTNDMLIVKMLDKSGSLWTAPVKLTENLSVHMQNTGLVVANGKVIRTYELYPSMGRRNTAYTLQNTSLSFTMPLGLHTNPDNSPKFTLEVDTVEHFVQFTTVEVHLATTKHTIYCRVLDIMPRQSALELRVERYNAYLSMRGKTLSIAKGSRIQPLRRTNIYGSIDWAASAMIANENADLLQHSSWSFVERPVGNPGSIYSHAIRKILGVYYRADGAVVKDVLGADAPSMNWTTALDAGFGSIYWMEGVPARHPLDTTKVLNIMRINNDVNCDLAAITELEITNAKPEMRFVRYAFVPGLGVGHPAIIFDEKTSVYWMATNIAKSSTIPFEKEDLSLHIPPYSTCEVDRRTLFLYVSQNMVDWIPVQCIYQHQQLNRHTSYPHMMTSGDDLLIVARATADVKGRSPPDAFYNNQNSNSVQLYRVRFFRDLSKHYFSI